MNRDRNAIPSSGRINGLRDHLLIHPELHQRRITVAVVDRLVVTATRSHGSSTATRDVKRRHGRGTVARHYASVREGRSGRGSWGVRSWGFAVREWQATPCTWGWGRRVDSPSWCVRGEWERERVGEEDGELQWENVGHGQSLNGERVAPSIQRRSWG